MNLQRYTSVPEIASDIQHCVEEVIPYHYLVGQITTALRFLAFRRQAREGGELDFFGNVYRVPVSAGRHIPCVVGKDFWDPTRICLIPLNTEVYAIYLGFERYAGNLFSVEVAPHVYFPLVTERYDSFDRYMRKGIDFDCPSLFIGTKSKRVEWQTIPAGSIDALRVLTDTSTAFLQHEADFFNRFQNPLDSLSRCWAADYEQCSLVAAFDHEKGSYIAAMFLSVVGIVGHCGKIATSKDPEYRPYSLVVAAQVAAVRHFFYEREDVQVIDLGINFEDCMSYKDVFRPLKRPLRNFPTFESTEHLESFLGELT